MAMKKEPKKPLQGQYWHRLFTLFSTTNLINNDARRSRIAAAGKLGELKETCISAKAAGQHSWSTHEMKIDRMLDLLFAECCVGRHGTSFKDCVKAIRNAVVRHGAADPCLCKMYKSGSEIGLNVSGLRNKEGQIAHDIRHDVNIIASNGGTVEVGQDVLLIRWQVMLTAE